MAASSLDLKTTQARSFFRLMVADRYHHECVSMKYEFWCCCCLRPHDAPPRFHGRDPGGLLLQVEKPVMVPAGAGVHGVLLSSSSLRSRHDLSMAEFSKGVPVARNARAAACAGGRRALPLQGEQVEDAVYLRYGHRASHNHFFSLCVPQSFSLSASSQSKRSTTSDNTKAWGISSGIIL